MKSTTEKGKAGEEIAIEFLKMQGFVILEKNWRFGHKEIDIIAKTEKEIVFIEVKSRKNESFGQPEESITDKKQELLTDAAEAYIQKNDVELDARFDVVTIVDNKVEKHMKYAIYPEF